MSGLPSWQEELEAMFPSWVSAGTKLLKELPGWDIDDLDMLQLRYIRRARGPGIDHQYFAMRDGDLLINLNDDRNPPGWYFEKLTGVDHDEAALREIALQEKKRRFDLLEKK